MKRTFLGSVIVWGLLLSPALCLGGVLQHSCVECDAISCAHETDCADDPCSEMLPRTQSELQHLPAAVPMLLSLCLEVDAANALQRAPFPDSSRSPRPFRAQRSLPLLI